MKYTQSKEDLLEHWSEQIGFIKKSCTHYDNGDFSEAKRIATSIRILFHHTRNSNSLVNQLELVEDILLWSSGGLYTPSNLLSSWSLLMMAFDGNSAVYKPLFKSVTGRTFYLQLEDWWNEIIFDDKQFYLSRKDVVLAVSNKDGGAHIDPEFDEAYANISKRNSLAIYIIGSDKQSNKPANNPIYASIRQIAYEILCSIGLLDIAFEKTTNTTKSFEMRYTDTNRRFKWSTTDIKASEETKLIINQFDKKERIYNIYKYVNGTAVEVIRNN